MPSLSFVLSCQIYLFVLAGNSLFKETLNNQPLPVSPLQQPALVSNAAINKQACVSNAAINKQACV